MCKRINNITTRGVVLKNGSSLKDMYDERLPLYEKYADITVDCDKNTVDKTVSDIVNAVNKRYNK